MLAHQELPVESTPLSPVQNFSGLTLEELDKLHKELYWQSWKCFGLKLGTPFVITGLFLGAIGGVQFEPEEDARNNTYLLATAGGGILMSSLFFSCAQHQRQREIDSQIKDIKEEIEHRRPQV